MLVPVVNRETAVNRRQVLLAVGGMSLISGPVSGLLRPWHLAPARPAPAHHASARAGPDRHGRSGPGQPGLAEPYPLDRPLYYISGPAKAIALTIDDGPSPIYTPQILDLLARYQVTATFSVIGQRVAAYPYLTRAVAQAGHAIANHTWTHADLHGLPARRVHGELARTSDAIHAATGERPVLFRAPYGAWTPDVIWQCEQMRMVPLDWSVDPRDWARPGVRSIVRDIMRETRPGSIILEHDGGGNRSETVAALKIVLPRLLDEGYHFQTP